MRANAPVQLDEFRDQLKIHIGEISEKVAELCTVVEGWTKHISIFFLITFFRKRWRNNRRGHPRDRASLRRNHEESGRAVHGNGR